MTFAFIQSEAMKGLTEQTWVSFGLVVVLIGATWWLGRVLGKIEIGILQLKYSIDRLKNTPARLSHIENHLMSLEEDLNNLFGAVRSGGADLTQVTRRSNFRPLTLPPSDEQ